MDFEGKIYYQQINNNFYYAYFQRLKVIFNSRHGLFNATHLCSQLCSQFNVELKTSGRPNRNTYHQWRRTTSFCPVGNEYEVNAGDDNIISGTYVDQHDISKISSWFSEEYGLKCVKIIVDVDLREN